MRLSNIWISSMELARRVLAGADDAPDAPAAADRLKASLGAAVQRAHANGYTDAEAQTSLFAVVAWMDELAMSPERAGSGSWRLAPLQRHYFSTTRAGAEFFDRLEALPEDAVEVREVYGLVLLAGFKGRYAHRPPDELAQYRTALLERIGDERQMAPLEPGRPLFPQSGARAPRMTHHRRGVAPTLASFVLVVLPLCLLLGLYLYLDYRASAEAADVAALVAPRS